MTRSRQDRAARRRDEFNRSHGPRRKRLSAAIDARRRMNAGRANDSPTRAERIGPSDPRYAYLTQSHD
jgi:hypothetical protein